MDTFKIEHFERDNPGVKFPCFKKLTDEETICIRNQLIKKLGLPENLSDLKFISSIHKLLIKYDGENVKSQDFNISNLMNKFRITPPDKVYINWYRFDEIDQMEFVDVARYFGDIWYPTSDDIELFDDSLTWILSVSHDGFISIWRES